MKLLVTWLIGVPVAIVAMGWLLSVQPSDIFAAAPIAQAAVVAPHSR